MRILVIGDLHLPYEHPKYLAFARRIAQSFRPHHVVFIGDVADEHAVAYKYPQELDSLGSQAEFKAVQTKISQWYRAFPKAKVCIGNHDMRPAKTAKMLHIPPERLKLYGELWNTPGWSWEMQHYIGPILFRHYVKAGSLQPAYIAAKHLGTSVVLGHVHSTASVRYIHRHNGQIDVAVDVGCGIDPFAPAFRYADEHLAKPIISVACITVDTKITANIELMD